MIGPSRRLVTALLLACIPFVLALGLDGLAAVGWIATAAVLGVAALDLAFAPRKRSYEVDVVVPPVLSVLAEERLVARIRNRSGAGGAGWARLVVPEEWEQPRLLEPVDLAGHGEAEVVFRVKARKRGRFPAGPLFLRLPSPLGLFWRDHRFDLKAETKVYPAISTLKKWTLLSRRLRTRELGLRAQRQRGQGLEFARLRDHHPGDDLRLVDWKATARRGRFIAREYQVERCQNVVLMVDAGRMLTEEVDGVVKIEYVLNAALMLTKIAAQYDDRVGALVFSDRIERLTPLRKGHAAVNAMAEALFDVQPRLVEADYEKAFAALHARVRKRSLVILFTNLSDQGTSELVSAYLKGIAGRHVPVCVAVGDRETREAAWAMPETPEEAFRKGAAAQLVLSRVRTIQELQGRGVRVVDAPAGQVSTDLINKYLELKRRQVL